MAPLIYSYTCRAISWCGKERKSRTQYGQIEDFVSRLDVLKYNSKAASHYGNIRADLERKGKTIGANDLHIAGHARSEGMVLITNNSREFDRVDALRLDNWS